jgi:HTH-type transcriptional regulator / antitoxin HigA
MRLKNEYMPDEVFPPGESLADVLEERSISPAELARRVGHPEKTIREILYDKAPITPEMAVKLEAALDIPARFWNARQAQSQESVMRKQQAHK